MAGLIVNTKELLNRINEFKNETKEVVIEINEIENTLEIIGFEDGGMFISENDPIKGKRIDIKNIQFLMG